VNRTSILLFLSFSVLPVSSWADPCSYSTDPLAQRDDHGLLHQMPWPEPSDFEPRYSSRFEYYLQSGEALSTDPAYVGAVQTALRRRGYYGGRSDGVFSEEVRFAIERLQKNHSQPVTGTLTVSVRRALHLP
jgi:hypothetical protein